MKKMGIGITIIFLLFCMIVVAEQSKGKSYKDPFEMESELPRVAGKADKEIRVLLKTQGYQNIAHTSIKITAKEGYVIEWNEGRTECSGETVTIVRPDDKRFQNGTIQVRPMGETLKILSYKRGYGYPEYEGILELYSTAEGIVIVNQLPIESYLCRVVPSEMPASYHIEALKAQAVCARSYAYNQTKSYAYPEYQAHVDDSTSYQVYGNSSPKESTIKAIADTKGQTLQYRKQVITAYYYSTSCGKTTDVQAWGSKVSAKNNYLQEVEICDEKGVPYEQGLPWYRWELRVSADALRQQLELYAGVQIGEIQSIEIKKRGAGDIALQLYVKGKQNELCIETENKIRHALAVEGCKIQKQDGSITMVSQLLPSAFITIEKKGASYIIHGGGYGHGIGMSQNGANEMAKRGKNYIEILQLFYVGAKIL